MRLLNGTPLKCSCCYGQYTKREHVDFVSAYEGPLLDKDNPRGGHIDWLVLCDECIRNAYNLLKDDERGEKIKELAAENTRLRAEARRHEAFAEKLQEALHIRPEPTEYVEPVVVPVEAPQADPSHEPGESEQLEGPGDTPDTPADSVLPSKPEGEAEKPAPPARRNRYAKAA